MIAITLQQNKAELNPMQPLRKIVILGGGTAGWIAAAMLANQLRSSLVSIEVVESSDLPTVGVGESTLPPFVGLLQKLGIDEREFLHATQGCYKLGIRFVDWQERGHNYFHPFGALGQSVSQPDFYQYWLKARSMDSDTLPLMAYSPCAVLADAGKFYSRSSECWDIGRSYALHFDASLAVAYFRDYALARGVVRTEGIVKGVERQDDGRIASLVLTDGRIVAGDFFFDCSGFQACLIGKALGVEFEDWSEHLPCDRAVFVKSRPGAHLPPYTQATARAAGWSWRIPLRNATGHGYVYSSRFTTASRAKSTLLASLDQPPLQEARIIPFTPGVRRHIWKHNCLALGLASGFIEPLESTSLHLIARGVDFFLRYFPDRTLSSVLVREFNRRMQGDYEEVRDFIQLHYCTSQRCDSAFWRHCRTLPQSRSLQERIALFRAQGVLRESADPLFRDTSWLAVFEGMGVRPAHYSPRTDHFDDASIKTFLSRAHRAVQVLVQAQPHHDELW